MIALTSFAKMSEYLHWLKELAETVTVAVCVVQSRGYSENGNVCLKANE